MGNLSDDAPDDYCDNPNPPEVDWIKEVRERVHLGSVRLDEVSPGWANRIDLESLDMADSTACISGQLFPSFHKGLEVLQASDSSGRYLGLWAWDDWSLEDPFLHDSWREEVLARR